MGDMFKGLETLFKGMMLTIAILVPFAIWGFVSMLGGCG